MLKVPLKTIILLSFALFPGCTDDLISVEEQEEQVETVIIHDYDYVQRQYFYLETPGNDTHNPQYGFGMFYPVIGGVNGDSLEVFIEVIPEEWHSNPRLKYYAKARNDINNDGDLSDGKLYERWAYLLYEGVDYDLIQDFGADGAEPKFIGIRLWHPLPENKALSVRYKMDTGYGNIVEVGDYGVFPRQAPGPDLPDLEAYTIYTELICPPEYYFLPPSSPYGLYGSTWNMMFRNVYSVNFDFLDCSCTPFRWAIEIWSADSDVDNPRIHDYSQEKYLRIFGLDQYRSTGDWGSDGYIDMRQGVIDFYNGHVMFPSLAPFMISKNELYVCFSEDGPPGYQISDSMRTSVDSLSANLERNAGIYTEPLSCNPLNLYNIVLEIHAGDVE